MGYLILIAFLITLCFPEMRKRYKKAWRVISHTGVFMKAKINVCFAIPFLVLVLIFNFVFVSCGSISDETKEYMIDLKVIKQEFLDKATEAGISSDQKDIDLKEIRRKLIGLGKSNNKKIQEAQELCLEAMGKIIFSSSLMRQLDEGQKSGRLTYAEQREVFDGVMKIQREAMGLFIEVDNILKEVEG